MTRMKMEVAIMKKLKRLDEDEKFKVAKQNCKNKLQIFNSMDFDNFAERISFLKSILGSIGENTEIMPSFWCDLGKNIYIGHNTYINHGVVILDCDKVTIGNHVRIAPGVVLAAVTHPVSPRKRVDNAYNLIKPIIIHDNVWIGANAVIDVGVSIGENSIVAAGSVVLEDVPANVVVGGVPAHIIRTL